MSNRWDDDKIIDITPKVNKNVDSLYQDDISIEINRRISERIQREHREKTRKLYVDSMLTILFSLQLIIILIIFLFLL
jgi:type III secretory pathway lipoprotein EscJ